MSNQPSPEFADGLKVALDIPCPVPSCQAPAGVMCTTPLMVRHRDKTLPPEPIILTGPHFERVRPDWVD